jgi:hypothetical protein
MRCAYCACVRAGNLGASLTGCVRAGGRPFILLTRPQRAETNMDDEGDEAEAAGVAGGGDVAMKED